jgi:hypothetical protein
MPELGSSPDPVFFHGQAFTLKLSMVYRNLWEKLDPNVTFDDKNTKMAKNIVEGARLLVPFERFYLCCGITFRASPTNRKQKKKLERTNNP